MQAGRWTLRAKLFAQRFWQPTSACLTCMPGSLVNVASLPHWELALRTGLITGALVLLLSFTRLLGLLRRRASNAVIVGCLTMIGDAYAHIDHYGLIGAEPVVTGIVSGVLAYAASYLLEDRAVRLRRLWAGRVTSRS